MKKITYHSQQTLTAAVMNAVNKLIRTCSEYDKTHESIDISVNAAYTCDPSVKLFHIARSGKELVGVAALFIPPIINYSVHEGLYDPSRGIDRGTAAIAAILGGLSYVVIFTLGFARIRKIFRENTPSSSTSLSRNVQP